MAPTMLHDLDRSLEALLRAYADPALLEQTSVTFATPGSNFPPQGVTLPALNLFLYDVQENHEYRGGASEWQKRDDGTLFRPPAPVRVDCHYLVTAWAAEGAPTPDQDEHHLLGAALVVLLRFRELPLAVLRGALAGSERPVRARTQAAHRPGELWSAIGGRPRPAFNYVVTLALAVRPTEEGGHPPDSVSLTLTPKGSS